MITTTILTGAEPFGASQGYGLDRVYEIKREGAREPAGKIRIVIRHDNRASQSSYRSEVWTPRGWTLVATLPQEPTFDELPGYTTWRVQDDWPAYEQSNKDCRRALEKVARQLLSDALKIVF